MVAKVTEIVMTIIAKVRQKGAIGIYQSPLLKKSSKHMKNSTILKDPMNI